MYPTCTRAAFLIAAIARSSYMVAMAAVMGVAAMVAVWIKPLLKLQWTLLLLQTLQEPVASGQIPPP